jgi:hypothetical protein
VFGAEAIGSGSDCSRFRRTSTPTGFTKAKIESRRLRPLAVAVRPIAGQGHVADRNQGLAPFAPRGEPETKIPGPQGRPFPLVDYGTHEIRELF